MIQAKLYGKLGAFLCLCKMQEQWKNPELLTGRCRFRQRIDWLAVVQLRQVYFINGRAPLYLGWSQLHHDSQTDMKRYCCNKNLLFFIELCFMRKSIHVRVILHEKLCERLLYWPESSFKSHHSPLKLSGLRVDEAQTIFCFWLA